MATRWTDISYAKIVAGKKRTPSGAKCRRSIAVKKVKFTPEVLEMGIKYTATGTRSKVTAQRDNTPNTVWAMLGKH